MKKIFIFITALTVSAAAFAMSRPKDDFSSDILTMTGTPVYIGNVPFEKLALKVSGKENGSSDYFELDFSEMKNSKNAEKEISNSQGKTVQISGRIDKSDNELLIPKKIIVKNYKNGASKNYNF